MLMPAQFIVACRYGELMAPELVVDAIQRRLHERRGAVVGEHQDEQLRRPVPVLAAVEIREIVIEWNRGGEDAFLAFAVERIEIVDEPVADRAVFAGPPGDEREVARMGLVVIALRTVDHERQHRASRRHGFTRPDRAATAWKWRRGCARRPRVRRA